MPSTTLETQVCLCSKCYHAHFHCNVLEKQVEWLSKGVHYANIYYL